MSASKKSKLYIGVDVGGKLYPFDVVIGVDGKVAKRDKQVAETLYGSSHQIGPGELKKLCKGNPEVVVIGTGQAGMASLSPEGETLLRDRGVDFETLPSREAAAIYNAFKGRKVLLLHVTC